MTDSLALLLSRCQKQSCHRHGKCMYMPCRVPPMTSGNKPTAERLVDDLRRISAANDPGAAMAVMANAANWIEQHACRLRGLLRQVEELAND